MPHDPALAETMREALGNERDLREQRMFGGICWMLNGNMLCGVEVGRYMFRVGKDRMEEALARTGCDPVIFGGRRMGGFVWVEALACDEEQLGDWIGFAKEFVGNLPSK
jgi:hypothetical protein